LRRLAPFALVAFLLASAAGAAPRVSYDSQVVVLVVTSQDYDEWRPWEKKTPETRIVQAVVLDGNLIATTADLVENATVIFVEKHGRPLREPARLVHVDADANLALLTVDKPGYFADLQPAALAPAMPTQGQVSTVRWRSGQLEISASRITRIEVGPSYLGALEHASLIVETDLSGGGWSEPLFADGRLIGLTYAQDEKSATVTPVDVLRAFLDSVRSPQGYREFANLELSWEINRDPSLTRYLGLDGDPRGILITQVPWGSSACGALYPRDILLSLDGHAIDAAGNFEHRRYGQLKFTQIVVDGHRAGDVVLGEVLRGGKHVPVRLTLRPARSGQDLMPARGSGDAPPYVIEGGLVFRELDGAFLRTWGKDWEKKAPPSLMTRYDLFRARQTPDRRRVVLLAYVLPSAYTVGYSSLETLPVRSINGRAVDSIDEVDEAFRHPEGDFERIVLEPNVVRAEVVLEAKTLEQATKDVLDEYQIPEARRLRTTQLPDLGPSCPAAPAGAR